MHRACPSATINIQITSSATNEVGPRNHEKPLIGNEKTSRRRSDPIALAVWGDPIVSQALVLLLRGSGYEARFLPTSSLNEPRALEDVQLLVLTPTPTLSAKLSAEYREALSASLGDTPGVAKIPVLELVTSSEETREGGARDESWYPVPWPCAIEKLEQQIDAALAEKSLG